MSILSHVRVAKFRKYWRRLNPENSTLAKNIFDTDCVSVGKGTYGQLFIFNDVKNVKLIIGSYCSIASEVTFLLGHDHRLDTLSTFPFKTLVDSSVRSEAISKGDIVIDDDVWIGYGATIMSNVHIGQGAVVAAGAMVTKNVPPYAIVGGVPARIIKYRFEEEIRKQLMNVDFKKIDKSFIAENIDRLYTRIDTVADVKRIVEG